MCVCACVCVCVCVSILDMEGSRVFASKALLAVKVQMAMYLTDYSDCLTSFHEPLSPPHRSCHTSLKIVLCNQCTIYIFYACYAQLFLPSNLQRYHHSAKDNFTSIPGLKRITRLPSGARSFNTFATPASRRGRIRCGVKFSYTSGFSLRMR